jgi:hypothetical protein
MLNALFILFILCCVFYLLLSPKKEMALLIVLHAFMQYAITLSLWLFHMNPALTGLLLSFMVVSSGLLVWARGLNYSTEQHSIYHYFVVGQWILLGMIGLFIAIKSPYYYLVPSSSWNSHINPNLMSIHPIVKIGGNAFIFSSIFLIILQWGQKWSIRQSLVVLGPGMIYFLLVLLLRFFQTSTYSYPLS